MGSVLSQTLGILDEESEVGSQFPVFWIHNINTINQETMHPLGN